MDGALWLEGLPVLSSLRGFEDGVVGELRLVQVRVPGSGLPGLSRVEGRCRWRL
ncbi:MAG: hypothetical protein R3F59_06650 [Myxococcota bacterium]